MKKLVTVTCRDFISTFKGIEDLTLLYPLKDFSVGYEEYFDIDEIDEFCLVNRILTDSDIDNLSSIIKSSNIKGIVFDDLGLIEVLKDLNITKILLLDHIANNSSSINYYLEYVDSLVVSSDITKEEIENIVKKAIKPVVIYVFGLKPLMYSRRLLLSNYQIHHDLNKNNIVSSKIDNNNFKIIENKFGTRFYAYPYYNALDLLDLKNVLYFWYDPILLEKKTIEELILKGNLNDIPNDRLFLDQKTVYKVGDLDA